jgi:serine O-acetyltransferase
MTPGGQAVEGAERIEPSWDVDRVVADLHVARVGSSDSPEPGPADRLPSRRGLGTVLDGLVAALFPRHFGQPDLAEAGVDAFVRRTLDTALRSLQEQVRRELRWAAHRGGAAERSVEAQAGDIVREFATRLPAVWDLLERDVIAAYRGDPAAKSVDEVLFCYPGVTAIIHHRIAHTLYTLGTPLIARIISAIAHSMTAVDIHPGAMIGGSFFIDHGTGVVIGETAIIGERVRLYQAVTLGAKRFAVGEDGALVKGIPRHPIVEDDVVIYAGATILGRITIGRGSVIGGNVWLTRNVPPESNITQAQARSEQFVDGAGI